MRDHGLGFRVQMLGFGDWGSGIQCEELRVSSQNLGFRGKGGGFRVQDLGFRA